MGRIENFWGSFPMLQDKTPDAIFRYGTAGFRAHASTLDYLMHRVGIFCVLRSLSLNGACVGVCITASHNPIEDNGVKIIEPNGEMLLQDFEKPLEDFVNSNISQKNSLDLLEKFVSSFGIESSDFHNLLKAKVKLLRSCKVIIGYDSRPSGENFSKIIQNSIILLNAEFLNLGRVTTPQMHFLTKLVSEKCAAQDSKGNFKLKCDQANPIPQNFWNSYDIEKFKASYSSSLIEKFKEFVSLIVPVDLLNTTPCFKYNKSKTFLYCDAANGVGSEVLKKIGYPLSQFLNIRLIILNCAESKQDVLNEKCGADYVANNRQAPKQFEYHIQKNKLRRCCSIDGDCDRLVYFTSDQDGSFVLLDGDRICSLFASVIFNLINECQIAKAITRAESDIFLEIGIIKTPYANSSSVEYLNGLLHKYSSNPRIYKVAFVSSKTGVKFLHQRAKSFDVGLYFESNGHGTVLTNRTRLIKWARTYDLLCVKGFLKLNSFLDLFNQCTGDALANILAVECSLEYMQMSFEKWISLYSDYCSKLSNIPVPKCCLDTFICEKKREDRLVEPSSLQNYIDSLLKEFPCARAFIRPSGTEPVCRIYVESKDAQILNLLYKKLTEQLRRYIELSTEKSISSVRRFTLKQVGNHKTKA